MYKILVNDPRDGQKILLVTDTGGEGVAPETILWDERKDGPMPEVEIGAMERSDGKLVLNEKMKEECEKKEADERATKLEEKEKQNESMAKRLEIYKLMSDKKASIEQIQEFLVEAHSDELQSN